MVMATLGSSPAFADLPKGLPKAACNGLETAFLAQQTNPSREDAHSSIEDLAKANC
jgi:hypothetical protein